MNWAKLVDAVARGESSAEEQIAVYFRPRVLAFLMQRTRDPQLALDLSQEILLGVICALREQRLRDSESLPAFVYGIARNRLSDDLRARAKENLSPLPENFDVPAECDSQEQSRLDTALSAIDQLEPRDQHILLLTLVEGLSPAEISSATGLSSMVVRQRKRRALKRVMEVVKTVSQTAAKIRHSLRDPE